MNLLKCSYIVLSAFINRKRDIFICANVFVDLFRANNSISNDGGSGGGNGQTNLIPPLIPLPLSRRMWTCTNCSYAYNRIWTERCEICEMGRSQPSVTQPSLITLTKTAEDERGDGDANRHTAGKNDRLINNHCCD